MRQRGALFGRAKAIRVAMAALGVLLLTSGAMAKPGAVRPDEARRLTSALQALSTALPRAVDPKLEPTEREDARATAEAVVSALLDGVDRYFHGPNLGEPAVRAHVAKLRLGIQQVFADSGPLAIQRDLIVVRVPIRLQLAEAAALAGDHPTRITHLRAALAVVPDDTALLEALRDAHLAAGDVRAADAVAARLSGLRAIDGARPAGPGRLTAP